MTKLKAVKHDLSVLIHVLRAGKPGAKVLEFCVETVMELLSGCYVVLDRDRARKAVRSEMVSLLFAVATGRVKAENPRDFASYLWNRWRRLVRNLLEEEAIRPAEFVYLSQVENPEGVPWVDEFLFKFETDVPHTPRKRKKQRRGFTREETRRREAAVLRIREFFPGCLGKRPNPRQPSLF